MRLCFFLLLLTGLTSCRSGVAAYARYDETGTREAQLFEPGLISTAENSEFSPAFTPNGDTMYFARRAPGEKQQIYVSTFRERGWSEPVLTPFSTDRDEAPAITADGKLFFFGSERPIPGRPNRGNFDMNVWVMRRQATGWDTPVPLPPPINEVQREGEQWPVANNNLFHPIGDGQFIYTTQASGAEAIELYQVAYDGEQFSTPTKITGLFADEAQSVYSAVVSPDGRYLVFNSYGVPGAGGGEDIFVSQRMGKGWSRAVPIGPQVNTADEESEPRFSRDGRYLFFTRAENLGDYNYGEWNIYIIPTRSLDFNDKFVTINAGQQ